MKFMELDVWLRAIDLVVDVYAAADSLPRREQFGLKNQICRAVVSVASNIAEGEGRRSRRDHAKFLANARGSLYEVMTQVVICERLDYLRPELAVALREKIVRVGQLINGTLRYLKRSAMREARRAT
jgi:four helix bundle protein